MGLMGCSRPVVIQGGSRRQAEVRSKLAVKLALIDSAATEVWLSDLQRLIGSTRSNAGMGY